MVDKTSLLEARIKELEKELESMRNNPSSVNEEGIEKSIYSSDLSFLLSITLNLLETVEKRKVLEKIIEGAISVIGLDTGALYILKDEDLFLEVTVPPLPGDYPEEFRIASLQKHPHILKVVKERSSLLINDLASEELTPEERLIVSTRNMSSLLYIPLFVMQKVMGVMIIGTIGRKYEFRKREIDLCQTLSNIGSLSLENSMLFEQLKVNINELRNVLNEKETTEKQLGLLYRAVEQSPVSIVITDNKGTIKYVNPKFTALTGYSFSEAIGQNPSILKSGHHSDAFYRELWQTINLGKDWSGEMKNKKKSGEHYWESVIISPMTNENGIITHFVGVKEDITEKKNMLENLISAKEKAEESDHLKSAFLHNISHEIRTPLNAIVGFSTFLNDPDLTLEKRRMYIDIILSSNDQLLYIIDEIMKVSHLEAGQVTLNNTETDISKLTTTLFNQFQPVAASGGLDFKLDNTGIPEGVIIIADEGKLKQVLSNLLDNAFKFTSKGFVKFSCLKNGDFIEFQVKDTGMGIPVEEQERIFERFYQAVKPNSQTYSGAGLGLSICSGYVTLMGGSLTVQSSPGEGSVFKVRIPAKEINKA